MAADKIRVLLIDDYVMMRQGVRRLLEAEDAVEVVAEAADDLEAVYVTETCRPDVIVLNFRVPQMSGLALVRQIKLRCPDIQVLALTAYDAEPYLFAFLQAGVDGYVLKSAPAEELTHAISRVHRRQLNFGPEVLGRTAYPAFDRQSDLEPEHVDPLTERELEVLRLVSQGLTNRGVGQRLGISHRTVQGHLANIYVKLRVHGRTEAVTEALRRGWITLE
jgi:two-component system response regulator DegU